MDIVQAVFPVFLVIAIGAGARRYRFFGEPFIDTANALVYYLLLPVLLFHTIGTSDFRLAFSAPLVAGGYAATVATFLAATLLARRLDMAPAEQGSFVQGSFRANLAYVGLPIVFSAAGEAGLRKAGILLGFMVPLLNVLAIVALVTPHGGGTGGRREAGRILRQILGNPIILSSFLGIVWSVLGLPLPGLVAKTLGILSPATLPLSLLCLGGSFTFERARSGFRPAAIAAAMKVVLLTAIGLLVYRALGVSGDDLRVGIIMLGCPTAVVTYVMAARLKGDPALAGTIVIVSTAASAFTVTGWLLVLKALGW